MSKNLPKHIAVIMDGNRRWAKMHNLPEMEGHRKGVESLIKTVDEVGALGIKYLSVYALSSENIKGRSKEEVKGLLRLLKEGFLKYLPRLKKNGVRLNFIGNFHGLPKPTQLLIKQAQRELSGGKKGVLVVALNYGGRHEIVNAARRLSEKKKDMSEENFQKELYTSNIPDPDLMIRTGGLKRLSNFLLWQLSYTEIYFTDILWPDFNKKELTKAIRFFQSSRRNFGT